MKVHRAELSGADQPNPYGAPLCFTREEFCVEVHDYLSCSALVRPRTFAYKQVVVLSTNNKTEELE
ncbi:hypothetical protein [Bradyrhizobium sp.]|jgi:hypothetical protein|uniref:hypothetical protein n=1 Tax=Bradyrhizobium sp. TaxID=376 RepID=UPI002BD11D7F|nr:hypothetical protein [Bradyrhizobium sp.]HMM90045.1 hypothetical protein [Bradyrhizobium sp.]